MNNEEKYFNLLVNCSVDDIDFDVEVRNEHLDSLIPSNQQMQTLKVVIDNTIIPQNIVDFYILIKENKNGEQIYQPNIEVNDKIKRKGVAYKIYQAFIKLFGHATSFFSNRKENAYNDLNNKNNSTPIQNLWDKLSITNNIHVNYVYDKNGKIIGQKAYSNEYLKNMDK